MFTPDLIADTYHTAVQVATFPLVKALIVMALFYGMLNVTFFALKRIK